MFGQSLNFGAFSGGNEIQFLAIAGGGGGGGTGRINGYNVGGGGGGGGGYINSVDGEASGANSATATRVVFNTGNTYTVTIGGGGSRGVNVYGWNPNASYGATRGNNGGNSLISGPDINTVTAIGGGGGGQGLAGYVVADGKGNDGGSGGGEGYDVYARFSGGSGTAGQGTGGAGNSGNGGGANGGGAASSLTGLYSSITGSSIARGGGGWGGRAFGTNNNCGWGSPVGGGGRPGVSYNLCTARHAEPGVSSTGGGGGGSSDYGYGVGSTNYNSHGLRNSAAGGSGTVILKIPTDIYTGITTGSPSVSTVGSDTILQFNGSGSYTH